MSVDQNQGGRGRQRGIREENGGRSGKGGEGGGRKIKWLELEGKQECDRSRKTGFIRE